MSNEKIALVPVWEEAGEVFDGRERAALAWVETVTRVATTGVPDNVYAARPHTSTERNWSISPSPSG